MTQSGSSGNVACVGRLYGSENLDHVRKNFGVGCLVQLLIVFGFFWIGVTFV